MGKTGIVQAKRKMLSVKNRRVSAPLFIVAGVEQHDAQEVEGRVRDVLEGKGGEIVVPRVTYKKWYSAEEARELFRLGSQVIVAEAESAAKSPTPSSVFLLFVAPASPASLDTLLGPFEFWAWPEQLTPPPMVDVALPPGAAHHWSKDPRSTAKAVLEAIRNLSSLTCRWATVARALRDQKSGYRLPCVNFRFPNEDSQLRDVYRRLFRGEPGVRVPRPQQVPKGLVRVSGEQHFRDACDRLFPHGHAEHGALRHLESQRRSDPRIRQVWLNAAYRFGTWIGSNQEHYDVQRAAGDVSPPDVFCATRELWVPAACAYVNIFVNDSVRDNHLFRNTEAQKG